MKITYELEKSPEPPMGWEEYERQILVEWNEILNRERSPNEREIQLFLNNIPV